MMNITNFDVPIIVTELIVSQKFLVMISGVAALKVVIVQKEHTKMTKMNVLHKLNVLVTITTWSTHMEL